MTKYGSWIMAALLIGIGVIIAYKGFERAA